MTKNNLICTCSVFALLLGGAAASAKPLCEPAGVNADASYEVPGGMYWMQAAGDCRVTYTTWGGIGSRLFNTCTRQSEDITSNIDAFPVPGVNGQGAGELYVHPSGGISFYKFADAARTHGQNEPFYSDNSLNGNYESIGLLPGSTAAARKVRISMGNNGGTYRDYNVNGTGNNVTVAPAGPVTKVCQNISSGSLDTEVPIMSRDGQMIAGKNGDSRKQDIYKIGANGNCTKIATVPKETGKMSFSFDNKHVAFITSDPRTHKNRLYEMDIGTGKVRTISTPGEDVSYMTYRPDGKLMYSRLKGDGTASSNYDRDQTSDLVVVDPKNVPNASDAGYANAVKLGKLWATGCNTQIDDDYAAAIGSRLNGDLCTEMVAQAGSSGAGLSGSCPAVRAGGAPPAEGTTGQ